MKRGLPAQNCRYCHVSRAPQKDSYKPEDLNDRGKWLMTAKDEQGAKDVKADWLREAREVRSRDEPTSQCGPASPVVP